MNYIDNALREAERFKKRLCVLTVKKRVPREEVEEVLRQRFYIIRGKLWRHEKRLSEEQWRKVQTQLLENLTTSFVKPRVTILGKEKT